jgi:nitrogen fixation/metabolism regulation signal transduction histidine kinase
VTQKARFIAYLVALHVLLAAAGVALMLRNPTWLLATEVVLALSLGIGIALTGRLYRHLSLARVGAQLIHDSDFTTRMLPVGQPEVDELIALYNRMVDGLRGERTRLQEQHHFLSQVLRASPSGIVVLDYERRITSANPAAGRLLGVDDAAALGARLEQLASPLATALASLPPHATEVMSTTAGRRVRCHHGTFVDRGFVRSFILIEELTEELRQAERRAYEKLIRVMAHEVNNSVTASNSLLHSSFAYAGELSDTSRPDFEQAIAIVIERTDQLNHFMRRFADVFRLPEPVKRPEPIVALLENNVRLLRSRPDAAGIDWQWEIERGDLTIPMDRELMEQAILNVLQNAVDAAGNNGRIAIRLHASNGSRPTLTIEDSGPGIDAEARANLFTPFFSTKPRGQGIGLTLVQEILSGHGFNYSLDKRPGEPTRFTIVF